MDDLDVAAQIIFVVGGESFVQSGAADLLGQLSQHDPRLVAPIVRLVGSRPSAADYVTFLAGLKVAEWKRDKAIVLIAVGGGRVIDGAKIIAHYWLADNPASRSAINIIAVPSTAGSGSEATRFAVCWEGGRKMSLDHEGLKPRAAILDHRLCISASVYQLATSGVDALCQGIEALLNVNAVSQSDEFARQAISTALVVLPLLTARRDNESMQSMLCASHFAGRAINVTRTTAPHAFSYYLTSEFGISHGHAVALGMANYLELFSNEIDRCDDLKMAYGPKLVWLKAQLDPNNLGFAKAWDCFLESIGLEPTLDRTYLEPLPKVITPKLDMDRLAKSPISRILSDNTHMYRLDSDRR
ncbi:Iron-containing alcohol dehydrogenase [Rhizobium multihospitium]|uniref:Iron-containing alcohol dehydrogenase n=2 Tax=Rhizobium multihospitium TaxID=410764 RepID=A0A1C3XB75_9HYPH|nr:Iron-containing alcohol dehydrogenase [Rhizobium multihospitium]